MIKYFGCGFFVTTSFVIMFEFLIGSIIDAFMYAFTLILILVDDDEGNGSDSYTNSSVDVSLLSLVDSSNKIDQDKVVSSFVSQNIMLFLPFLFMNAFLVVGPIMELAKYFGYRMVHHPDLLLSSSSDCGGDEVRVVRGDGDNSSCDIIIDNDVEGLQCSIADDVDAKRDTNRHASSVTIGMIAISLGFYTCENLLDVFGATQGGREG